LFRLGVNAYPARTVFGGITHRSVFDKPSSIAKGVGSMTTGPAKKVVASEAATLAGAATERVPHQALPSEALAEVSEDNPAAEQIEVTAASQEAAQKAAQRSPARKAAAKKGAARKGPAKKAARKGPAKKAAQRSPAKKAAARKTAARKAAAKKAVAKKAAARKPRGRANKAASSIARRLGLHRRHPAPGTGAKKATAKKAAKKAAAKKVASRLAVRETESPWTPRELREVRRALQGDAERLRAEISVADRDVQTLMRDHGEGAGNDQADVGSNTFERDHEMAIAAQHRHMLQQVERALSRIKAGTYGVCERCGNPIGKMRLMAFPRATLCVTCKQLEERR
jgi:RNA polymerase-binding protein DksA